MTDLLLTLWLLFGSFYAFNISICLLALHFNAKSPVGKSWLVGGVVVNVILVVVCFPIVVFNLSPPRAGAVKLYKVLSEGYEEYQENKICPKK